MPTPATMIARILASPLKETFIRTIEAFYALLQKPVKKPKKPAR